MSEQLTIYQHQVPQHYLKLWKTSDGLVWWHELSLEETNANLKSTKRILGENNFYENDPERPNNEIEKYLSGVENAAAPLLKAIANLPSSVSKDSIARQEAMCAQAAHLLSAGDAKIRFLNFISAQLVRTSRTVGEIARAIASSDLPDVIRDTLEAQNRPFELVKLGMERLPKRLKNDYTVVLSYSDAQPFVTSDHPVVEISTNPNVLPQTVYNVLHQNDTFLAFPINPQFHCLLLPPLREHPLIQLFAKTLQPWANGDGIALTIRWRPLQPELIEKFRLLQTGFGRRFLISCQDDSELIDKSPLRRKS